MIFSLIFVQAILLSHYNFWKNAPIFKNFSLLEKSPFHLGTTINFVALRQFKNCLYLSLNIYLDYKSRANWSFLTEFRCVLEVSNLSLRTKNYDGMLDTLYRDSSKSWIFVIMYAPLFIDFCGNVITRTISIRSF